ncbi:uncharacterized protein N7477_006953 [Penicillium maclennaniae]|uniref:uncharacterized protein n=1 Tax=Penicillium maclennaniae TaxID=1343394 RepID=UPI002541FCC5|nr:uncharacterized protein N7477_006953 [Penicillium maclennaniae]KAJ5668383.1 hypothetical protein N7477_006953 [Penicillium maclennaniae]
MADHNNPQWHGRAAQHLPSPPNANSPLSPPSGGGNPISFQTNVNRAKTRRWVEAKQYSYDGGDWGDEDDEEEEELPIPPQPPYATHRTGSSSELSSRRLSGLGFGTDESRASPSAEARADSCGGDKALPFVRPVDLYKRMREERPSVDSGRQAAASLGPIVGPSAQTPVPVSESSTATRDISAMGLPEVKRISSFGTEFLSGGDPISQQETTPESQQSALHHNPSQASSEGFTSVVHQAFDVPETPSSTTAGSVGRSNSDGTSVISPIMSNRTYQDDKTPTIHEDPAESNTPTGASTQHAGDYFKAGHRRDMSLPSRDNSPSKLPVVMDQDPPKSGHGEISAVSPNQNYDQSQTSISPLNPVDKDFVAPLKIGSTASEGYRGEIPTIVAGNSPEDADHDKLREEIMRSLSRENSQEPEEQPQSQSAQEESIPHQYEKFWDGTPQSISTLDTAPRPLASESNPLAPQNPYATAETPSEDAPPNKPKLARRFSWESSDGETPTPQIPGGYTSPPPLNAALAIQEPEPISDSSDLPAPEGLSREPPLTEGEVSGSDNQRTEKPRLAIVLPTADRSPPPPQIAGPRDSLQPEAEVLAANSGVSDINESKLQGFREILALTTPQARIRAFDQTRDQFAGLDTGLTHWLELTVHDHPEHAGLIQSTQSLSADFPRTSPARSKFPKLGSLGNLTARDESAPAIAGHARRPSGHIGTIVNRQNVAQSGKDLLHTAGSFGGKAGEAAKGLFAKGKSKFRPSGDKGQSTNEGRRKSGQFQPSVPSEATDDQGSSSLRRSLDIGNLRIFKSRTETFTDRPDVKESSQAGSAERERANKGFKRRRSMDFLRNTFGVGSSETPKTAPSDVEKRKSGGFIGKSDFANDFEQEMIAAFGLSPTNAGPEESTTKYSGRLLKAESGGDISGSQLATGADRAFYEDRIPPVLPSQKANGRISIDVSGAKNQPSMDISRPMTPSIRPVFDEDVEPLTPPKDSPPKGLPSQHLPSKDASLKDASLVPRLSQGQRQQSISTLGVDERQPRTSSEGELDTPPSPIQETIRETDDPVYEKPLREANSTESSLPLEEDISSFAQIPRPPSSAEVLESKRKSISGLPPSAPGVQSPLRNEVRYSPGTRSSMLSFGSWGRQSQSRPATPANDLSRGTGSDAPAQNGDSKMEKLKSFGRRRRASVGDLLTIRHDNNQGNLQDLPEGGKRKLNFGRISGLFNRSREPQSSIIRKDDGIQPNTKSPESKGQPTFPTNGHNGHLHTKWPVTDKELPAMPALEPLSMEEGVDVPRDARRASLSLQPTLPPDALLSNRFYSSMSEDVPSSTRHTRVKSQPLMEIPPLSPIAPSDLNLNMGQSPRLHMSDGRESQELHAEEARQSQKEEGSREPVELQAQPGLFPSLGVKSRKETADRPEYANTVERIPPKNITVSGVSVLSNHPHRDSSARTLNESAEPVELAITNDDSSEEIIMSPTAYPGQEWTPMHY